MKKYLYTILSAVILTGCMTSQGLYEVGLEEVERPENTKDRYGDSKIVNLEEDGTTKYSYEDELIKMVWLPLSKEFAFTLQNKTDHSIKIIWDEAVYVDENGSSGRVMHAGVKYTDRNNPQPPTVIPKGAKIEDIVVPTDNIYYVNGRYGGWQTKPLFPNAASTPEELNSISQKYIGETVKVQLPLQIEETVNEYVFTFKVEDFKTQ